MWLWLCLCPCLRQPCHDISVVSVNNWNNFQWNIKLVRTHFDAKNHCTFNHADCERLVGVGVRMRMFKNAVNRFDDIVLHFNPHKVDSFFPQSNAIKWHQWHRKNDLKCMRMFSIPKCVLSYDYKMFCNFWLDWRFIYSVLWVSCNRFFLHLILYHGHWRRFEFEL